MNKRTVLVLFCFMFISMSCLVQERCLSDIDCSGSEICLNGECLSFDSVFNNLPDINPDLECPSDMINIENRFCIDKYEASQDDATGFSMGTSGNLNQSLPGVIPWHSVSYETASSACQGTGKRLCVDDEWMFACMNKSLSTTYPYGNDYTADICNGIDTFCPVPEPHCWDSGDTFQHYVTTGTFGDCKNNNGIYDLSGNVWEWVFDPDNSIDYYVLKGGAYNCIDSETLHRCSYTATGSQVSARGFRCCGDGIKK